MEQNKQILPPGFIETNLQLTKKRFRIPTDSEKEVRGARRDIIKLRYTFNSQKLDYMNFTIELVIGKKKSGKHVQYSLEYIKKACS